MPFDFGNKYGMNKAEFEKSIQYFQDKITMIEEDETISPPVKRWFIKRYNKRIKELEDAYQELQETINHVKATKYVDEETATINNLSPYNRTDKSAFRNLGGGDRKHKVGQFFRVLSMFTIIGIPFAIPGMIRSSKRHKMRRQENIDLQNFVNESNKPYASKIGSDEPFSEEEMIALLSNPTELAKIVTLTTPASTTLNPTQKNNLTKKLIGLKEYAQKHGYSVTSLIDSKFDTKNDKLTKRYAVAVTPAPTDLKEAHEKVVELKAIKTNLESILETDPDNKEAKTLLTNVNNQITTFTNSAKTFVSAATSAIDTGLDAKRATSSTKAALNTSNNDLDAVYNTPHAKLGTDLTSAKTMAAELGIDTVAFDNLSNKYTSYKNSNNEKLAVIEKEEAFDADMNTIGSILSSINPASLTSHAAATTALAELGNVENLLNKHKAYYESLPIADARRTTYKTHFTNYNSLKAQVEEKQSDFDISSSDFSTYQSVIASNVFLGTETKTELQEKRTKLQAALDALNDPRFDELFKSSSKKSDLITARSDAQVEIGKIDAELANIEKTELNDAKKIAHYEAIVNANKPLASDTTPELLVKQQNLKNVLDVIDKPDYKDGFAAADPVITDAKNYLADIDVKLNEYTKFVDKLSEAYNYLMNKLAKGKPSSEKMERAQAWYNVLQPLASQAASFGLTAQYNSIFNAYKGYLKTKTFDATLTVSLPSL